MTRTHEPTGTRVHAGAAVLWASAFIVLALIIVQAGKLPGREAHAAVVADRGSYTLLTASGGRGGDIEPDELLYVIDSREQILIVYEIEDARRRIMVPRAGHSLDEMFLRARQ